MDSTFEKTYHELEKDHFWFKARRNYIVQLLHSYDKNSKVLDIGCSSGILLHELSDAGFKKSNLYGIDISEVAIKNCQDSGLPNTFVMDAQNVEFNQNFDIIIASDCLEHLEDDAKALQNWYSLLSKNGTAFVFVPAFMSLWSSHDDVNFHFRRYERRELENKMKSANFTIIKSSYWNALLFAPIALVRKVFKKKGSEDKNGNLDRIPKINSLLLNILNIENNLLKKFDFPIGVSSFCIAKKL